MEDGTWDDCKRLRQQVDYFDNESFVKLIEGPQKGIFPILDEASHSVGHITDETFLAALNQKLSKDPHYDSRQCSPTDKTMEFCRDFRITHYAGKVTYSVMGFLDKNKDTLYQDLKRLCYNSRDSLLSALFPDGAKSKLAVNKRPPTAATLFNSSISALVTNLQSKAPYYVRCIKPNETKSSSQFDSTTVGHQVKYLGLLENVRVRRAGFAYRMDYTRFLQRYKMLSRYCWPNFRGGSNQDGTNRILRENNVIEDCVFGNSKVFIRHPQTVFKLEESRANYIPHIVVFLQKCWRGALARIRVRKMKALLFVLHCFRRYKLRKYLRTIFSSFRDVEKMPDLGRSVEWPAPPAVLKDFVRTLRSVHLRWRLRKIRSRIPREEWPMMSAKLAALEALRGKRREFGFSLKNENPVAASNYGRALVTLKKDHPFTSVLYSSLVQKYNHRGKKAVKRGINLTDQFIGKLDPKTFNPMRTLPLSNVEGVSVTSGSDSMVVLNSSGHDFVFFLLPRTQDLVGEFVGLLSKAFDKSLGRQLRVTVGSSDLHCVVNSKERALSVEMSPETVNPVFLNSGRSIRLLWPTPA